VGSYILIAELKSIALIDIKPFRTVDFQSGIYGYCGSACGSGGLKVHLRRHLKSQTTKHWRFDYLKERLVIEEIWWLVDGFKHECEFAQSLLKNPEAAIPLNSFGASDCSKCCPAHLIVFPPNYSVDYLYVLMKTCFYQLERFTVPPDEID